MTRADVERPATRDPARPGGWEPPADVQRRWHKDGFQPQTTLMSAAHSRSGGDKRTRPGLQHAFRCRRIFMFSCFMQ